MNAKTWIPLAVAVVLGLMAALVARKSLLRSHSAQQGPKIVTVVVAKASIPPGHELVADDLGLAQIAAQAAPAGTFSNPVAMVGRVTVAPMVEGQPVLPSFLAPRGSGSGLQALVPPGMRAITLDVNEASGVAGLLIPGCHVDVVTTAISQDNPDKSISRTIVQNAQVVAVGQRLSGAKPEGERDTALSRTVTLLASPRDAEALDLAMTAARLRLVLRGSGDRDDLDDEGVMLAELRGGASSFASSINLPSVFGPPQPVTPPVPVTPPTQPATQPAVASKSDEDQHPRRVVTVILGNDERRITFREDDKPGAVTDGAEVTDSEGSKVPQ